MASCLMRFQVLTIAYLDTTWFDPKMEIWMPSISTGPQDFEVSLELKVGELEILYRPGK
jgi:hypothetical protein